MTPSRLLLLALLTLALPATAQVYKWVDKDGNVHYSDKAPRDPKIKDVKDMQIESAPTDPTTVAADQEALKARGTSVDAEIAARKQSDAEAAAKKAQADERERQCLNARADLEKLQAANRVVTKDANGKETYATGGQLEAQRVQAKNRVAEVCD
jgi:hypothetical protein